MGGYGNVECPGGGYPGAASLYCEYGYGSCDPAIPIEECRAPMGPIEELPILELIGVGELIKLGDPINDEPMGGVGANIDGLIMSGYDE